ncbi:hypothetical protein CARUB_v10021595mg, partial [Capsella rubella]
MGKKRKSNIDVRVVGRRIYDSKNGKSCHQCRQKTMDFVAPCKATNKNNKTCPIKFCYKCLSNGYAENAEEVVKLEDWCRGICVCSVCMKARGLKPTGILVHQARACGWASVFELLQVEGPDKFAYQRKPKLVLGLKEGQAETVVSELFVCGRTTRSNQCCSIIEMMIQLLDLISQDREMSWTLSATDSSWFTAIGEIVLESQVLRDDEFPPETFEAGVAEYEKMDPSRKLKLLIFLCDESLSTRAIREYIKSQTKECEKQNKEAKEKAATTKKKEKQLKQKMQGDVAKAIMEKNGAPLSIEEHNLIVSQIRAEANEAHMEMMEAKAMRICHARRTEPIMKDDDNGLVLWKLKCYEEEESKILLQDLGAYDNLWRLERWLALKPEQTPEIEKCLSYKNK